MLKARRRSEIHFAHTGTAGNSYISNVIPRQDAEQTGVVAFTATNKLCYRSDVVSQFCLALVDISALRAYESCLLATLAVHDDN